MFILLLEILWWVRIRLKFLSVLCQCWCRADRLPHCDWSHAGEDETWEVGGHLWSCNVYASSEELHGADRGAVHVHPRGPARGCTVWQYRSPCTQPLCPHPEAHPHPPWRDRHHHGTGVQGTFCLSLCFSFNSYYSVCAMLCESIRKYLK